MINKCAVFYSHNGSLFGYRPIVDGDVDSAVAEMPQGADAYLIADTLGYTEEGGTIYPDIPVARELIKDALKARGILRLQAERERLASYAERERRRIVLFFGASELPEKLVDLIAWLENRLIEIPESRRAFAKIDIHIEDYDYFPSLKISYESE